MDSPKKLVFPFPNLLRRCNMSCQNHLVPVIKTVLFLFLFFTPYSSFLSPLCLSSTSFSYRKSLFYILLYLSIPFSFSYLLSSYLSLSSLPFFYLFQLSYISLHVLLYLSIPFIFSYLLSFSSTSFSFALFYCLLSFSSLFIFLFLFYLSIPFSFSYLLSLFHIFMSIFSFLFFVLFSCNSLSLSMNNLSPLLCLPSLSLRLY